MFLPKNNTNKEVNVLLTGSTGFIGSYLLRRLIDDGYNVFCLVRKNSIDKLKKTNRDSCTVIEGDLSDKKTLERLKGKRYDYVVNVAAKLGEWFLNDADLSRVNVKGVENLIRVLKDSKIKKFVHVSTAMVSGVCENGKFTEKDICYPDSSYERTKYQGEKIALARANEYKIPIVIIRPTFTYGPGDPHKLKLFKLINTGFFVFPDGGRSFLHPVYVDDLVDGILLSMKKGKNGNIYIIGGSEVVSVKYFVSYVSKYLEKKLFCINLPSWILFVISRVVTKIFSFLGLKPILLPSQIRMLSSNWNYSIEKSKKEIGFRPKYSIRKGLKETINSYIVLGKL